MDMDDDLIGIDLIEENKPVPSKNNNLDLDLFGDEIVTTQKPNQNIDTDDLLILDEPSKPQMSQPPLANQSHHNNMPVITPNPLDNPYAFLDNIHTLETVKALHDNDFTIEDDEFVESDVTFAEPPKIHAFESSDIIIQYSSKQVF